MITHSDCVGAHLGLSVCLNLDRVTLEKRFRGDDWLCALFAELCVDTILRFVRRGCPLIKDRHGDDQNHPVKLYPGWETQSGARQIASYVKARKRAKLERYVRFEAA